MDCKETLYYQELSSSEVKKNSNFFEKLKEEPYILWKMEQDDMDVNIDDITNTSSIVHIYFKEPSIVSYSRYQAYSDMEILGNK